MGSRRSCAGPAQVDEREKCVRARCPEREATGRCQRVYDTGEPGAPRRAETGAPHVGVPVAVRTVVRSDGTVRPVARGAVVKLSRVKRVTSIKPKRNLDSTEVRISVFTRARHPDATQRRETVERNGHFLLLHPAPRRLLSLQVYLLCSRRST